MKPLQLLSVICADRVVCSDGDLRLVNETQQTGVREGRLEICFQGVWGAVYDTLWTAEEAAVTCQNLGFDPKGKSHQTVHVNCHHLIKRLVTQPLLPPLNYSHFPWTDSTKPMHVDTEIIAGHEQSQL